MFCPSSGHYVPRSGQDPEAGDVGVAVSAWGCPRSNQWSPGFLRGQTAAGGSAAGEHDVGIAPCRRDQASIGLVTALHPVLRLFHVEAARMLATQQGVHAIGIRGVDVDDEVEQRPPTGPWFLGSSR